MKKLLFLLFAMIAIKSGIIAQDDSPVIVVATEGKIKYIPSDKSKAIKIEPGTVVKSSGSLKVGKGSSVVFLSKGTFTTFKKEGEVNLQAETKNQKTASAASFEPDFADYLKSTTQIISEKQGQDGWTSKKGSSLNGDGWLAVDPYRSKDGWLAVDPYRSKDGWGAVDPYRSKDGMLSTTAATTNVLPFGKLRETTIPCACAAIPEGKTCTVEILEGDQVVQTTECCVNGQCTIDLKKLKLKKNFKYAWRQKAAAGTSTLTQAVNFMILANEDYINLMKKVKTSKLYISGNPSVKGMMEAAACEQAQLFFEAETIYDRLLDEAPKDKMLQMNKASLLVRIGNEEKAMQTMKGK